MANQQLHDVESHHLSHFCPLSIRHSQSTRVFRPGEAMASSPWFNRELLVQDARMRSAVQLINQQMDVAVESMAGYPRIDLDPAP